MKRFTLILVALACSLSSIAEHITGGEMYYTFLGMDGALFRYKITLKLYRDCYSQGATLDASAPIAIFERGTNRRVSVTTVAQNTSKYERLEVTDPGPCINNPPVVCYEVGYYEFETSLPASPTGYMASYQRCCRINGISNLVGSGNIGATYTAIIPGTNTGANSPANNSAKFVGRDAVIVCGDYAFEYSFAAEDPDLGDQLRYYFSPAYPGGGPTQGVGFNNATPNPPAPPPYSSVNYAFPYNGGSPLGPNVTINPNTGLITGRSPAEGIYVVTVSVDEIRNGVVIATQRKDVQIKAGGCDIAKPPLDPEYITCDGLSFSFHQRANPLINTYYWEFGDVNSGVNNTSNQQSPTHNFSAPGTYTVKVVANRGQECSDSSTAIVKVFPGFFPAFTSTGVCVTSPVQFTDQTTTNFGVVNYWQWDFADNNAGSDIRNPSHQYSSTGTKTVRLVVGNSVGCRDTVFRDVLVIDKPPITLAFKDTLICVPDPLTLQASGTGNFSWTPNVSIQNANTATPTVNPTTTTKYYVQLDQQGCINTDSVNVRVVTFVTVNAMPDTTICLTDPVQLRLESDGLRYEWTPAGTLNDPTVQNPIATPTGTTVYNVIARIGSCSTPASITVNTVPYPVVNAGLDTMICYNTPAFLRGSHDGSTFAWTPIGSLTNFNTLTPTAHPARTQPYVLTSWDTRGCPKPSRDTVLITVLPKIIPYAGNDTMVVIGQPLQLNASGGVRYEWSPSIALSNPNIKNPIAVYDEAVDSIRYTVEVFNELGCSDSAAVKVVVFKTNPYVFVPTGFSPNGDGLNDVVRPIAVGVERILYFRVFNRWGQMVFSTTTNGHGWDGTIGGVKQGTNVYVWMVSAIDYTGKTIFLKGTTTLIR